MIEKKTVLILFGGESSEHSVSITSAKNVFGSIDKNKYNILLCFIDKSGTWRLVKSFNEIENNNLSEIMPIMGQKSFIKSLDGQVIKPDVIFPVLHGENGEDGTVQGLARLLHIPIVGCGVMASAVCIDKDITKQILEFNNIKTVPYQIHHKNESTPDFNQLSLKFGEVLFIKPARCGSSVGINKARNSDELAFALCEAHKFDSKVLIEKAVNARELEVGILGNSQDAKASCVGEIKPEGDFYSFDSKYSVASQSEALIPADISKEIAEKIRNIAIDAYKVIGCEGLARVDFFLSDDGELYLNEINTLPGFTNISMYPKLWMADGMTYSGLIDKLIDLALYSDTI